MTPFCALAWGPGVVFNDPVHLDDAQIDRYSRQIVLSEVGPRGQLRLLAARVGVLGTGVAVERAIGYLAAAGVGRIAAAPALRGALDPEQPDTAFEPLVATTAGEVPAAAPPFDALLVVAPAAWPGPPARVALWIAGGALGAPPACPTCAGDDGATPVPPALAPLRDALLGTVAATELVKALLAIGTPLRGQVLRYDPAAASVTVTATAPRAGCPTCRTLAAAAPDRPPAGGGAS